MELPGSNPFNPDRPLREEQPMSARVPDRALRGVYTTGQLVLDSPKEYVIDFLNALTRPHHVAARVVLAPQTMNEFITALTDNLNRYTTNFGPPPPLPTPPPQNRPTIQEIYENFKLPEDQMSGSYANSVLIGHGPTEFFFDFITGFYPTPAVSNRVLIAASHVPRFLQMLQTCQAQFQQRYNKKPEPPTGTEPAAG